MSYEMWVMFYLSIYLFGSIAWADHKAKRVVLKPEPVREMTAGEVAELRQAREIIRRVNPALAMRLDALHEVPPCPKHKPVMINRFSDSAWSSPKYKCRFCQVEVHCVGNNWYEGPPLRLNAINIKPRPPMSVGTRNSGPG